MIKVEVISKELWAGMSESAHLTVFCEKRPWEFNRIDFALMAVDEKPLQYVTCRELDQETLYWQYGGSFPSCKGTPKSFAAYKAIIETCRKAGYKRITFLVENNNFSMLKFAMASGFMITGVKNFQGSILLEHILEFTEV